MPTTDNDILKLVLNELFLEVHNAFHRLEQKNKERHQQIMTALEQLSADIADLQSGQTELTAAVNDAITHIGSPGATDAQLLTLSSTIKQLATQQAALAKSLRDAVNPPPPAPPVGGLS